MSTPKWWVLTLDNGTRVILNTGEVARPDGVRLVLSGQPLTCLIGLVEAQGLPVARATLEISYGIADPKRVICALRSALADSTDPFYYVVNVKGRGWRLAHYSVESEERPPLDISSSLLLSPSPLPREASA